VYRRGRRIGQFNDVQRGVDEAQLVIEAHADQIGRLNADPVDGYLLLEKQMMK
jgi:hypothetical protein